MKSTGIKVLHMIFFLTSIIIFCIAVYDQGLQQTIENYLKYLTTWGIMILTFYFYLEIFTKGNRKIKSNILTLQLSLQSVIAIFYWGLMHKIDHTKSWLFNFRRFADHIYPIIFVIFEFIRTDYVIENKQMIYIALINTTYFVVNISFTFYFGVPVYDGVTWNNKFSVVFTVVSVAFGYMFFFIWKKIGMWKNTLKLQLKKAKSKAK